MARIRTIKPELPQSESMGNVSRDARLTFILMWTLSDDAGRLRGNSRMLASLLFPYDDDAPELIEAWLMELEKEECIVRYKIAGQSYVQIYNWLIHQKIDKPSKSKIPPFNASSRQFANPREDSSEDQGSEDQGSEEGKGNSVPNGTGGEPPAEEGHEGKTAEQLTKDELWKAGKSLLSAQGMPAAQCGTFVGKLVKDYGNEIVIEAVRAAVVERPADAASFLKAACMARKKEGGKSLIPWHATDKGVEAKGLELDPPLKPNPGENSIAFKTRVIAAVENGGKAPMPQRSTVTGPVSEEGPRRFKPADVPPLASLVKSASAA